MPFQVTFSYKVNEAPPVILITAGEDQQAACQPTITLTAIVDVPANLPGHTLEWEQTEGNPVILSCPTCLSTTYNVTDQTDKTFRFWIDRGINGKEQYDDVSVKHTPTSVCPQQTLTPDAQETHGVPSSSPECDSIIASAAVPAPVPGDSNDVPGAGVGITWDEVERVDLRPFVTQYTVYESGIAVEVVPVGNERIYSPLLPTVYQIFTEFIVNGIESSEYSCERDFTVLPVPSVVVIDETAPQQTLMPEPQLALTKFGNIVIGGDGDTTSSAPQQTLTPEPVISVVRYGNILITVETDNTISTAPFQALTPEPVADVTRFSSGGIGG